MLYTSTWLFSAASSDSLEISDSVLAASVEVVVTASAGVVASIIETVVSGVVKASVAAVLTSSVEDCVLSVATSVVVWDSVTPTVASSVTVTGVVVKTSFGAWKGSALSVGIFSDDFVDPSVAGTSVVVVVVGLAVVDTGR